MAAANDVASAVATAIQALSLVPADRVVRRKRPGLPPKVDPPGITVTVKKEGEEVLCAGKVVSTFAVQAIRVTAGGDVAGDDETAHDWDSALAVVLEARLTYASVPGFNVATVVGGVPFDTAGLDKTLNVGSVAARVEVIEDRS